MKKYWIIILYLGIALNLTGCATITDMTLPASHKDSYEFASYEFTPPINEQWRFIDQNKMLQSLTLINGEHKSFMISWVTPILHDHYGEERDMDIVEYFQNKYLEELNLDPDVVVEEEDIVKSEEVIGGRDFKVLSIVFEPEDDRYDTTMYYHVSPEHGVMYNMVILTTEEVDKLEIGAKEKLFRECKQVLADITLKMAKEDEIVNLRMNYALSDFAESIPDNYIKEKIPELQKRYDTLKRETDNWLAVKENNYYAHSMLGYLTSFNDKFEQYGEGFDEQATINHLETALDIRPYYLNAHTSLAELYKSTAQNEKAIEHYEKAIEISPNDENLYYELGQLYEDAGQLDQAKMNYDQAVRHWGHHGQGTLEELKKKLERW